MKIGIIGAGSVGLLAGAYLGRDHEVRMYVRRKEQKEQLEEEGIWCDGLEEPTRVKAQHTKELEPEMDLLMVTVKQHQLDEVLNIELPADVPLLFLQNGMGHVNKLTDYPYRCWVGVVEHGALKQGENVVAHTGRGKIEVARFTDRYEIADTIDKLHTTDFPFSIHKNYREMLASKLVVNAVINPVTTLFQVENRCVAANPYVRDIACQLCKEACNVLDLQFDKEWERVQTIADNTAHNQSSMLKDILENRQTEIDAISGYILGHSEKPLPYHQFVIDAVHAIEYKKGVRTDG